MTLAIETEGLVKRYGKVTAVDRLSIKVEEGEIYAFLGLNGAGKTTTMRMLLGMIKPNSGVAIVLGRRVRPGRREPWAEVGYLVEIPHAYGELSVRENLEAARRLHPGTPRSAVDEIIESMGLAVYAGRRASTLSQGNAQRLGIARALLHHPRLLLLDEPANGLDPAGIVEIRELLLRLARQEGATIFISSHILGEVARLANRIGIIHEGRLLQELDIADLEQNRERRLVVRTHDPQAGQRALAAAGLASVILPDDTLELKDMAAVLHPDHVATLLVKSGNAPLRLVVEEEELEQYFLRLVGMNGDEK